MYPQQNTQNSTYPLYPPPPPNNNFPPNYLVPTGPPNPMVVAQPSQIKFSPKLFSTYWSS